MTALVERKTRLTFETADCIRYRGRLREVVVDAHAGYAEVRLKGTRQRFTFSWGGLYHAAAKAFAEEQRAQRKAARRGRP